MKLSWNSAGERFYETGSDRGVLYLPGTVGVAWNGLISVTERSAGAEPRPYYIDGFKYANLASAEEFEMSIEAFSAPYEFGECVGVTALHAGLFVTQQSRKAFGFTYRTRVGNDLQGVDHGYKLHIVYNALAGPSDNQSQTISNSPEPTVFSWDITSSPKIIPGAKPSAHLVIDSRIANQWTLRAIERLLYGTDTDNPYLPTPEEIIDLFVNPPTPEDVFTDRFESTF